MAKKLDLIEELTTHKNDYQHWTLQPVDAKTDLRVREPPTVKSPPPAVKIDPQSHAPYKPSVHVPFDMYLKPKPIVGTDPRQPFSLEKPKLEINRERHPLPTLLSPTLDLSQVACEVDLNTILNYTYNSVHKIIMEEAALKFSARPKPPNRVVSEESGIIYKPVLYPYLKPEWITAARHWDCLQSRNLGDPFKTFWTRRGPEVECSCCCNPLPNFLPKETKEEISQLICENKLRLPYDVTKTGYGGYKPITAKGVSLDYFYLQPWAESVQSLISEKQNTSYKNVQKNNKTFLLYEKLQAASISKFPYSF